MMLRRLRPSSWPLTLKVPALVAALTVLVAAVISNGVIRRLVADQEANLRELTQTYLDGLSTAVLPNLIRDDVWETFDILDRARDRYTAVRARHAIVIRQNGTVLAASDPHAFPVGATLPPAFVARFPNAEDLSIDDEEGLAWVRRVLRQEGKELGSIVAEIDIHDLLQVRREVLLTLIAVNGALTLLLAAGGYYAVRRMVRPVSLLTDYVDRVRDGAVVPIPDRHFGGQSSEFGRLFASFNSMAAALREREALTARLAEEERIAQLGKLASGMAHEVNNPLGGMLTLVDTLRKHGHDSAVRQRSLDLIERGLMGIRDVVRATLTTYKGMPPAGPLCRADLDDLRFLIQHEIGRRHLRLDWRNGLSKTLDVDGAAVRQIALNLLLNACAASPEGGSVRFEANTDSSGLVIVCADDGPGLPREVEQVLRNPQPAGAPPSGPVGLGVWTICQLLVRHRGRAVVERPSAGGTCIAIVLPLAIATTIEPTETLDAVA